MARTVAVNLAVNGVQAVVAGFGQVGAAAQKQGAQIKQSLGSSLDQLEKAGPGLTRLGSSLMGVGALAGGALALLGKAAMGWESAWAGVRKTVDGTEADLAGLEGQLRSMAKTLPSTHQEIAAVAEAAGQLGVKTADVAGFTRVMIDLGQTTNLSADEAATSLAQLMNVMQTAPADVGRLGATVVALGNAGASTERDIVQMAQRIAGAGRQVGLSEAQVLAYANALASVGIEAEAGGTAISQAFLKIDRAVRDGGAELELLAKTSGMSADAFRQAWGQDAAGAMLAFTQGLGRAGAEGKNTTAILSDLGITGIRESDALRRLAASGDVLADSLKLSGTAWQESSALAVEALKRYDTAESRVKVAWNNITDAAITAGGKLLPIVADIAQGAVNMAEAWSSLPSPVQSGLTALLGTVAVGGLVAGGFMKMTTAAIELASAWRSVSSVAGLSAGLKGLGLVAVVAAGGFVALTIAQAEWERQAKRQVNVADDLLAAISKSDFSGLDASFVKKTDVDQINGLADAMFKLKVYEKATWFERLGQDIGGAGGAIAMAKQQLAEYDKAISALNASGNQTKAMEAFNTIVQRTGQSAVEVLPYFKQFHEQLRQQATALGITTLSTQDYADWMGGKVPEAVRAAMAAQQAGGDAAADATRKYEEQKLSLDKVVDSMFAVQNAALQLSGSQIGMEAAFDAATKAAKENGRTLDLNTEAGRSNQQALNGIAAASLSYVEGLIKSGAETSTVTAATQRARDEFITAAVAMGAGRQAAEELANKYGLIPGDVQTTITTPGMSEARGSVEDLDSRIRNLPPNWQTYITSELNRGGIDAAYAALNALNGKTVTTYVNTVYRTSSPNVSYMIADGAVMDFYAGGGLREKHVAQIAPAGAWRVWAEDETGGEAYIPLAPQKRDRSRAIWLETGKRLGMLQFADGGLSAPVVNVTAPTGQAVNPAALAAAVAAALDGSRLVLGSVDPITHHVAGTLRTALARGV